MTQDQPNIKLPSIDALLKSFSLILTTIIVLTVLKKSIFYSAFNIKLTDYIDFSEALLIFFNDIIFTTFMILLIVLFSFLIPIKSYNSDPQSGFILFMAICQAELFILLYLFLANVYKVNYLFSISISALGFVISFFLSKFLVRKTEHNSSFIGINRLLWGIPILLFLTFLTAYTEISRITHSASQKKITCVFYSFETVSTGIDTTYLGRTKGYIFFFSRKDKRSIVFQSKDIREIKFDN